MYNVPVLARRLLTYRRVRESRSDGSNIMALNRLGLTWNPSYNMMFIRTMRLMLEEPSFKLSSDFLLDFSLKFLEPL